MGKKELFTKLARSENSLYTFVVALIVLALSAIWFVFSFTLWIKIPITVILILSLYYQLMAIYFNVAGPMMYIKLEDRIVNELYYQTTKRGYEVTFVYRDETLRVKKHNLPKYKAKWIKFISFLHVVSRPAWAYRDVDSEDSIEDEEDEEDEEDDVVLVPTALTP